MHTPCIDELSASSTRCPFGVASRRMVAACTAVALSWAGLASCSGTAAPKAQSFGTVTGVVSSSIGGRLGGVLVDISSDAGRIVDSAVTESATGRYTAIGVPVGSGDGGATAIRVPANCSSAFARYAGLEPNGTATADIVLPCAYTTGTIRGTITASYGGPIAGATVTVTPNSAIGVSTVTSDSGTYVVTVPIKPNLGLIAVTGTPSNCLTGSGSYDGLVGGDTENVDIVVTCSAFGSVAGKVSRSDGGVLSGVPVILQPANCTPLPAATTDSSGGFAFPHVPVCGGTGTVSVSQVPVNCSAASATYSGLRNAVSLTADVQVQCVKPDTAIAACQAITVPGYYTVVADLTSLTNLCLRIEADSVTVDCGNHTVTGAGTGIIVERRRVVTIRHCRAVANGGVAILIQDSQHVLVASSTLLGNSGISAVGGQDVNVMDCVLSPDAVSGGATASFDSVGGSFIGNHLSASSAHILASASWGLLIGNNTIASTGGLSGAGIELSDGGNNVVAGNQIDGGWNGDPYNYGSQGAEEGILLMAETGDTVRDNAIQNVFSTGIEAAGPLSYTVIAGNQIANALVAGVGSYWGTSWTNDKVIGNAVFGSMHLITVDYQYSWPQGQLGGIIEFRGNTFRNNKLQVPASPPIGFTIPTAAIVVDFSSLNARFNPPPTLSAAHDTIAGDTLPPTLRSFFLDPDTAFVDDGGNPVLSRASASAAPAAPPAESRGNGGPIFRLLAPQLPCRPIRSYRSLRWKCQTAIPNATSR